MALAELNTSILTALVDVLEAGLPQAVKELNAEATENVTLPDPVQVLPYMPVPASYNGGLPIVAVQDLPGSFDNDLVHSMEATYGFGIAALIQTADHASLAIQLRGYQRAIFNVIQADRLLGPTGSILAKPPALVQYTKFAGTEPGPLLGNRDPENQGKPPTSFRSWAWLLIECRRQEVGG